MNARRVVRHVPAGDGRTYCGRDASKVSCISLERDAIDEAECKSCQRSDDRRQAEAYIQAQRDARAIEAGERS